MKWFKDFFLGKEKTVIADVKKITATISTESDSYTVTREGAKPFVIKGDVYFHGAMVYLNKALETPNFITADDGSKIPVHVIKKIAIKTEPLLYTTTYR